MAKTVHDALQRAAARSARLNDRVAADDALKSSKRAKLSGSKGLESPTSTTAGSPGASSSGSTVPGTDAAAKENALLGYQQAQHEQALANMARPSPPAVPPKRTLARVNSVPIFSPVTPVDRIRRTSTPTEHGVPAVAPAAIPEQQKQVPVQPEMTPEEAKQERKRLKKIERKAAKFQRREAKRARKETATTTAPNAASHEPQAEGCPEPAPHQLQVAVAQPKPAPSQPMTVKQEPGTVGPRAIPTIKVAAKKSSAKPSQRPGAAAPSDTAEPNQAVKAAQTPVRTDEAEHAAREQATQDNFVRANTASQVGTPQTANRDTRSPSLETLLDRTMYAEKYGEAETVTPTPQPGTETTPSAPATQAAAETQPAPQTQAASQTQSAPEAPSASQTQSSPEAPSASQTQSAPEAPSASQTQSAPEAPSAQVAGTAAPEAQQQEQLAQIPGPRRRREMTTEQKALHARYMRFSRSFQRRDCPKEMKTAFQNAAYCSAKLSLLKEAWEECAGEWRQSSLYRKITNKSSVSSHGARVWLTRDQICVKYNNNQEVANAIRRAKEDDEILCKTQIKDHPDAPGVQALRQYLVWDSEGISECRDTVIEDLFTAQEGSDSDGEKKLKKKKREPSSSKGSDHEESDSDDESSGQDKKKKNKNKKNKRAGKKGGGKKETKEKKEKRLRKEQEKLDKEKKKQEQKDLKDMFNKAKKAMSQLNDKIVDASSREKNLENLAPDLKKVIGGHLRSKKNAMCDLRLKLQTLVDTVNETGLLALVEQATKLIEEYTNFLSRSNMK